MNHSPQQKVVTPFQECLVKLRSLTRMTQRQLANRSGTSHASVNRWELGKGTPKRDNAELLGRALETEGVPNASKLLIAALRRTIEGNGLPEWAQDLESIERSARHVTTVTPAMVPGYLQCPSLAREIFRAGMPGASDEDLSHLVDLRTERLGTLPELNVTAIFPAAAIACLSEPLRRAQASYLIKWAESGRAAIHLVPEGSGLLVPASPLMLFRLSTGDIAVVSDHADGNVVHDESHHDRLTGEATWALAASLPVALSLDVLRKLA
ncbi:Scr1 family TA system antitoxin-like transcriptional regulator [Nocardiopsis alba]|uniref:Scr1 family TA system antitoxin-like transcriptional regulator n=1 Tax=Nocardiopsis alba TaxID=53437 RepID=UPI0033D4446A